MPRVHRATANVQRTVQGGAKVCKIEGAEVTVLDRDMSLSELQEKILDERGYPCTYKLVTPNGAPLPAEGPLGDLNMILTSQDAEVKEEFLNQLQAERSGDAPPAGNGRSVFPANIRGLGRDLPTRGGERINEVRLILQLQKHVQPLRDWQQERRGEPMVRELERREAENRARRRHRRQEMEEHPAHPRDQR